MESTLILLVRHGVTPTTGQVLPGRAPGLHLSDTGREQAREVAQRLRELPLSAIYSSPMERTRETAAPTAELFDLVPRIHSGLLECEFGDWTGARLSELAKLPEWRTVQSQPSAFRFPGGESFPELQQRMLAALAEIRDQHRGQVVACFSHADPLKAAVAEYLGVSLDAFQRVRIDPGSVSAVEFAPEPRVVVHNSRTGSLAYLRQS